MTGKYFSSASPLLLILEFLICTFIAAEPGKVISRFKSPGSFSTGMTFDGKHLWVADYKADKLYALNPGDGTVAREIPSPGFWPMGLAWDGKYLWNVDARQKRIFQVDPKNGVILRAIQTPSSHPSGLTWDGKTLWVGDQKTNRIMKIDISDGTALKRLKGPSSSVNGLTFDGKYIWSSDRLKDEIYMMDPESGQVIIICRSPAQYSNGLAWDGEYIWNVDYQADEIYKLARMDNDLFKVSNTRKANITLTHKVKIIGTGNLRELNTYIAIPRDSARQKILSKTFSPAKYKLKKDRWHQPVAVFNYKNIPGSSTIRSVMRVKAKVSEITYYIFPDRCGKLSDIPEEIRRLYTRDGSKYLKNDPYIQKVVKRVVGDEKNPYWIARKIFDFVRNTLEYKMEGGWNAAPFVLKRGTGSCSEYSFSFISLARAAGLPARYVGAIVVRGDDACIDESFHRWPEAYLPNYGWITIDPQAGDKPSPRDVANAIGHRSNRYLITTRGGGDSKLLGWYYNCYEDYKLDPQVIVKIDAFGEWEPAR